jgi:DNA polymerase III subunit alpha
LFDEVESEVRKFAKLPIEDLIDSRDTQLLAAIVSDLRVINGNRGKVIIFKLDDKTKMLEASVDENLYNTNRHLLKDDELVIVQGTLQRASERFGERFKVTQVFAGRSERYGAGYLAAGARFSTAQGNVRAGGVYSWAACAPEFAPGRCGGRASLG